MAVSILPRAMATAVTAVVQMKDRRRPFVEDRDDELVCYLQNVPLEIINANGVGHARPDQCASDHRNHLSHSEQATELAQDGRFFVEAQDDARPGKISPLRNRIWAASAPS